LAVKALRASLFSLITCVEEVCDLVEAGSMQSPPPTIVQASPSHPPLRIERSTYTLHWRARECDLGNTIAFQIMERLGRRPNEYISMERLLDEIWVGSRTLSTVRSTVCRLRCKLRQSGMADLAASIDGSANGHYRLALPKT
jgi:DNA-binding response OmpR family regulator